MKFIKNLTKTGICMFAVISTFTGNTKADASWWWPFSDETQEKTIQKSQDTFVTQNKNFEVTKNSYKETFNLFSESISEVEDCLKELKDIRFNIQEKFDCLNNAYDEWMKDNFKLNTPIYENYNKIKDEFSELIDISENKKNNLKNLMDKTVDIYDEDNKMRNNYQKMYDNYQAFITDVLNVYKEKFEITKINYKETFSLFSEFIAEIEICLKELKEIRFNTQEKFDCLNNAYDEWMKDSFKLNTPVYEKYNIIKDEFNKLVDDAEIKKTDLINLMNKAINIYDEDNKICGTYKEFLKDVLSEYFENNPKFENTENIK